MSGTLAIIKQTYRTILFEEFTDASDTRTNLYDIIQNARASKTLGKDEFYREIEDKLMVRSFNEFVE